MERSQVTRRSVSHGPFGQSSSIDNGRLRHLPTPRGPLQSVDGNTFLLTSPAPLASLLKKTTETGDIGLFSIGSARSFDAFHSLVRPSSAQPKSTTAETPPIEVPEEPDLVDDRKSLPSYRDSALEIRPLYESVTTTSGPRSFSSPSHPRYPRSPWSYSMTTCSSGLTWVNRSRGTTPGSGSSDLRHPTLVCWGNQSHGRKEYATPKCGRRTPSLSSIVGMDERPCDEPKPTGPCHVVLSSSRCFSYSEDTDETLSNSRLAGDSVCPIQTLNPGFCQAKVSD
jgi:hypothetical protein